MCTFQYKKQRVFDRYFFTMSFVRNLVVVGGRNASPASVSTRLDPVKLESGMGIAAKSIAFGEVANIRGPNSKFILQVPLTLNDSPDNSNTANETVDVELSIPEGNYKMKEEVLAKIVKEVDDYLTFQFSSSYKCEAGAGSDSGFNNIWIKCPGPCHLVVDQDNGPWELINARMSDGKIWVQAGEINQPIEMGFLYANIVENSYINGKKARILAVFPIEPKKGYTFFEFQNITYVPIEVKEFSEISIELRDIRGHLLRIDNSFNTIINLHIKDINTFI